MSLFGLVGAVLAFLSQGLRVAQGLGRLAGAVGGWLKARAQRKQARREAENDQYRKATEAQRRMDSGPRSDKRATIERLRKGKF